MAALPEQFAFFFEDEPERDDLAADLVDRRRMPTGPGAGATRLLRELVKQGLGEDALRPAASICLWLDEHPIRGTAHLVRGTAA